jgi:hypothetical protein
LPAATLLAPTLFFALLLLATPAGLLPALARTLLLSALLPTLFLRLLLLIWVLFGVVGQGFLHKLPV